MGNATGNATRKLHKFVAEGNVKGVKDLLRKHKTLDISESTLRSSAKNDIVSKTLKKYLRKRLYDYVYKGKLSDVRRMFSRYNGYLEIDSMTFHCAARRRDVEILNILIENGANVNALINSKTAIQIAVSRMHFDIVEVLLKNGAEFDDSSKTRALFDAVRKPHLVSRHSSKYKLFCEESAVTVKMLLQSGADANAVSWGSVLENAVCHHTLDSALLLVCFGARIDDCAIHVDNSKGILFHIKNRTIVMFSKEERRFLRHLAFVLAIKSRSISCKLFQWIASFVTYDMIFMGPEFKIGGEGSAWGRTIPINTNGFRFVKRESSATGFMDYDEYRKSTWQSVRPRIQKVIENEIRQYM